MDDDVISIPSSPEPTPRKIAPLPARRRLIARKAPAAPTAAAPAPALALVAGPSTSTRTAPANIIEIVDSDDDAPPAPVRRDKGKGKENAPRLPLFFPDDADAGERADAREHSPFAEGPLVNVPEQLAPHRRPPWRIGLGAAEREPQPLVVSSPPCSHPRPILMPTR
jgi:hypothetical protein